MSVGRSSLILEQSWLLSPTGSTGALTGTVDDVPQIGGFRKPLNVTVSNKTVFTSAGGLSGISRDAVVAVTGRDVDGKLAATAVGVLGVAPADNARESGVRERLSASQVHTLPVLAGAAGRAPVARASSLGVDDQDAFTRVIQNLGPAVKYDAPLVTFTQNNHCYNIGGGLDGVGTSTLTLQPQAILSLGQLSANFPFDITYNPMPSSYQASGNVFSLGPLPDWLNFVAEPGTESTPTLELIAGASIGIQLMLTLKCPGLNLPPVALASVTIGYSVDSATTKPMPGVGQSVTLDAKSCVGINDPVNVNLLVDPRTGFPDLSPAGNWTAGNVSFCDQPTITGTSAMATVGNLTGATVNQSTVTFDPAQSGSNSVTSWGTFFPTAPQTSFTLTGFTYLPAYVDGYRLVYTVLGVPVLQLLPTLSPWHVTFQGLQAKDAPVTISSESQPVVLPNACDLMSVGQASSLMGNGDSSEAGVNPNVDGTETCNWYPTIRTVQPYTDPSFIIVSLTYYTSQPSGYLDGATAQAQLENDNECATPQHVQGVGDDAYFCSGNSGTELAAEKNGVLVELQWTPNGGNGLSPPAESALASIVTAAFSPLDA